jgi:hypothetical protein
VGIEGVAVGDEEAEAAAVFFMGIEEADGAAAERPTVLDGDGSAARVFAALLAGAGLADLADFFATVAASAAGVARFLGALSSGVAGAFAAEETFFAAGTAAVAATAFLTAGLDAGVALAAGFFT